MLAFGYPIAVAAALVCAAATAVAAPNLNLSRVIELPHAGLRLRVMSDAAETPLPALTAITFRNSVTGELFDRYTLRDLWQRDQHLGRWRSPAGYELHLLQARAPLPDRGLEIHVAYTDYEKMRPPDPVEWDAPALRQWLFAVSNARELRAGTLVRGPIRIETAMRYEGRRAEGALDAYLVRFRREPQWYAAVFTYPPDANLDRDRREIEGLFLESFTRLQWRRETEPDAEARYQERSFGAPVDASAAYQASRKSVIDGIRNMRDWWFVESPHYLFVSNLGPAERTLIRRMQSDMPLLREAYASAVPPRKAIDAVSVIRVFARPEEYEQYVPPDVLWTHGVWIPARQELIVKPPQGDRRAENQDVILRVLYHEAFHQYLFYGFDRIDPAMWYNEGHADFFAGAEIRGRAVAIGENAWRAPVVERLVRARDFQLRDILELDHRAFYGRTDAERERHYALAWGLVYYLRKGAPLTPGNPYRLILSSYGDALWRTRDGAAATKAAFDRIAMDKLEADFVAFWNSRSTRSRAERTRGY